MSDEPEELKLWWKVRTVPASGGWLIVPFGKLDEGIAELVSAGQIYQMELVRKTQREVDELGDFDGW